jgi:hypothetical protein
VKMFPRFERMTPILRQIYTIPRKPSYLGSKSQAGWLNGAGRAVGTIAATVGRVGETVWGMEKMYLEQGVK